MNIKDEKVLITLDDPEYASRFKGALEGEGMTALLVSSIKDLKKKIDKERPSLVILTGGLHEDTTTGFLEEIRDSARKVAIIGIVEPTDRSKIQFLQKFGIDEILEKPVDIFEFVLVSKGLLEREELVRQTNIIGKTEPIREVLEKVAQFAPVNSTVLIDGESGTGKELVAQAIHKLSPRRHKPFIAVNCAALPETLLESELFGHEKGSFTGATSLRKGRFEIAHGGTLFLDEIGEMSTATQVKLLRVLEEKEFTRVGGSTALSVDVRILAATNKDLKIELEKGNFRRDLYYRLKVLTIEMPPLRARKEDIALLVNYFMKQFADENEWGMIEITDDAMAILKNYDWPGNVRELRNLVESMMVISLGTKIRPKDIPEHIFRKGDPSRLLPMPVEADIGSGFENQILYKAILELRRDINDMKSFITRRAYNLPVGESGRHEIDIWEDVSAYDKEKEIVIKDDHTNEIRPGITISEMEKRAIELTLKEVNGNRRKAAEMLGIGERTLYRKIKEYRLA